MTERCLLRGASGNLAGHEGPNITGSKGVEGRGLTAVKEIFTMLVISGVLPPLGRFDGHVVEGAARIETREEGHNWTIAAGEKSVKKFLAMRSSMRFPQSCHLAIVKPRQSTQGHDCAYHRKEHI